jgi:hypothetical protein
MRLLKAAAALNSPLPLQTTGHVSQSCGAMWMLFI